MPEQDNPTPPSAPQAQSGPSQPPPPPGYQYGGWYIPAQPPPPPAQQPTGGKPDWLTGWKLLVVLGCVAFVCLYGVIGSLNLGNQASRTAARAMQTGPRLTSKQQIDAQNELDQRQKKLAKDQEELRNRQEKILGGKAGEANNGTTATGGTTTAGNSTTSGNASTAQVSQTQKVLEDIRAERLKQQYASLWTSPIVAVREVEAVDGATATAPAISGTINAPSAKSSTPTIEASDSRATDPNQKQFPYDHSTGPYHVIQKGTVIGATLMLDLDGERGGPVVAQIDKDDQVYVRNTDILLWPEGTEVIGTAQPVAAGSQRLLGVSFESVVMQDGYAMALTKPVPGLSQQGQGGLAGQVNTHWASKLGWSLAIGAIEGLSTGSIGLGTNSGAAVILRTPGADMSQLFGGILNRANGVKIPAGTRIKIILTDDLPGNPEYANHQMQPGVL